MFVVYEVWFYNITPIGDKEPKNDRKPKSNWKRLKEFETLEEANEYLQTMMKISRDVGTDTSYTIVMES